MKGCESVICERCGGETDDFTERCECCGAVHDNIYTWSELIPMPVFYKKGGAEDEDDESPRGFLSKRTKRMLMQITAVIAETALLAGVIGGIYLWKQNTAPLPPVEAENIVYSSDDIVMMLVNQKDSWIMEKPDEGYNACCFLDLDYDGSPELISIAYDSETAITSMRAFNVRSCTLEEILPAQQDSKGFFDIGQHMELFYAPDTKEMLYLSYDNTFSEDSESELTGCFYMYEKQIYQRMYFGKSNVKGEYVYEVFGDDGKAMKRSKQEYLIHRKAFNNRLVDLKLSYEWVQNSGDIGELSSGKLAALLLRSYDSFFYDTSGLAIN